MHLSKPYQANTVPIGEVYRKDKTRQRDERESRKRVEEETGHEHVERRGEGNGDRRDKGAREQEWREQESEEGAGSPLVSGTPGCCQVTVGVELRQNANSVQFAFRTQC